MEERFKLMIQLMYHIDMVLDVAHKLGKIDFALENLEDFETLATRLYGECQQKSRILGALIERSKHS